MLDLKHFKKIGHTKTHSIFEHKDGHVLHIAHDALKPEHKKELKDLKMAEGGNVPSKPSQPTQPKPEPKPEGPKLDPEKTKQFIQGTGFADGGEVPVQPMQSVDPTLQAEQAAKDSQGQGLAGMLANPTPASASPIPSVEPVKESALPATGDQPVPDVFGKATLATAEAQNLGEQAAVASKLGDAKAHEYDVAAEVKGKEAANDRAQTKSIEDLMQHRRNELEAAEKDMNNGHFHPRSLFDHRNGTWNNILTGVGLILGGRGLGGKLIDVVQKQIDADNSGDDRAFEAMKEKFGNDQEALKMMNIYKTAAFANELAKQTALAQSPEAKLNGQQAVLQLTQGLNQKIQEAATQEYYNKARQQSLSGDQSSIPQATQRAGLAIQQIPEKERGEAMKELKQQANISHVNNNALQSFDEVAKLSTIKAHTFSPIQTKKQIEAAWDPMMDKIVKVNEGRVTPITVDLMKHLKPSITDNEETLKFKRDKFKAILDSERAAPTLQTYGVPIPGVAKQLSGDIGFKPKK